MRRSWPSLPSLPSRAWAPVAQADPPPARRRLLPPLSLLALAACLLPTLLLPTLLLPALLLPAPPPSPPAAADRRPHLLLLLADQARLSAHGLLTPHLDEIATHGARFARAYSSTPICTPARAALLTGRSAWRHGLRAYVPHVPPPLASRAELAATLAAHGYHTAVVGKSHFGVDPATGDFRAHGYAERHLHEGLLLCDERSAHFVRADEYAAFFARACAACDPLRTGRPELDAWRASERNGSTVYNMWKGYEYPYDESLHPTRWTADTAIKVYEAWLRRRHAGVSSQPLFLKVSFHRPHAPYDPPARWVARVRSHRIPPPAGDGNWARKWAGGRGTAPPPPPPPRPAATPPSSSLPSPPLASPPLPSSPRATHPTRCSAARAEFCGGSCGYQSFCGSLPPADASHTRLMYYASLAFVDEQAGAILARVRASAEEYARMLVLYTSDHGDALGDHHLWRKGYPYEDVASIPFYLRWPEAMDAELSVGRGVVLQHLVELRDVFPTLAAAAGIALPSDDSGPDGQSLWPLLSSGGGQWRQQLLLELSECSFDGQGGGISWVSVTDGRGKYVWFMLSGEEQLFNLTADPSELVDLAREAGAEARLRGWRSRLAHEFEREGRGSEWTAGGTIPPGAHRRRCTDFLFTPNYKGAAPAPPPPDREGSVASNPNGMEDSAASHSQGIEGMAASHLKGNQGAVTSYPDMTEGAVTSYPNGTEGAVASYPNGTEGAVASHPNGTDGAAASHPNGIEGMATSHPNRAEGTASHPLGTKETAASHPNVVFVLTDDQDLMLGGGFPNGGATPMPHTQRLLADQGAVATNFFAHTPICCPSRAQLLTGRYFHNLKRAGYTVGVFGKWLNTVANWNDVPPGVDAWFVNGGGDYIAPKFHARHLAHLGVRDGTWVGGTDDYSTAVIGNLSLAWVELQARHTRPFFAYVAPKASHEPFTPAPWHAEHWEAAWPADAPRTPNWNCSFDARARHHGNIATSPMLTAAAAAVIRGAFRNRWRTLLSVDAVVAALVGACERLGIAERTYFAFTSDHRFQLGQLNLPLDKRHVYDWNTRVPLLLRGPGIAPRSVLRHAATLVDLAPTFLGMAGVARPDEMDGRSLLPLLVDASAPALPAAVRAHLEALGPAARYGAAWRDAVLLEHLFVDENTKCVANCTPCAECRTPSKDVNCATPRTESGCWSTREAKWKQLPTKCSSECFPTESLQNNFVALRHVAGSPFGDSLYAEFQAGQQDVPAIDFCAPPIHIELFNITQDPWQMDNLHSSASAALERKLRGKLHSWLTCQGATCP
ncbi:hypothetical protein AB1Y20_002517 [Prymnesium parvum]|uniref:Sulfatase N-terminal domain-containing protein n=1 Tax=Prymnesium parvum TaxID=97485 RepID=A0AB34J858_PRYPA